MEDENIQIILYNKTDLMNASYLKIFLVKVIMNYQKYTIMIIKII